MEKQKILVLVGTRPEAIKLAPVISELINAPQKPVVRVCLSGQHHEMVIQVFRNFDIKPDIDLGVMRHGQTLASLCAALFTALDGLLEQERPDWLVVQGDTSTVMVGALCAYYRKVKVAHVEAGLRSFNKWAPFPEEINRKVAGVVADLHFAPTEGARANLLREGVPDKQILVTGNTVIDALLWTLNKTRAAQVRLPEPIEEAVADRKRIVLVTGHRRESFGAGLASICDAISNLAQAYEDTVFVYPVHLNPNVQEPVQRILGGIPGVLLTKPLSYLQFVKLMSLAFLVLTDSGGVQEEAPSLGKPVLVMRDTTERPEGIAAGVSKLVGADKEKICAAVSNLLDNASVYESMAVPQNPYGDGHAAARIATALLSI